MASKSSEIVTDFPPVLRIYKDGTVERLFGTPFTPPSPEDPTTGVSSKDIKISLLLPARVFLPKMTDSSNQKLPILVYFHGGGFCGESAFSSLNDRYVNLLVSQAMALTISVEYRLAPENPLPAAYEDCWAALQWVASHVDNPNSRKEPWLVDHGNFNRIYLGGESAGANIAYNLAMKAGVERLHGDVKIFGAFLSHPYFWGSKYETNYRVQNNEDSLSYKLWMFAFPSAAGGIDNPMINPLVDDGPSLSEMGCSRLFVSVAGKDRLRETGLLFVVAVRKSGWKGELDLVDTEGEDHVFHVLNPESEKAKNLIKRLASFIKD
nr:HID6 [Tabernaemontana elegans]